MTCIIGYGNGNKTWFVWDSCASGYGYKTTNDSPKVFVIGDLVIGVAGSIRVSQVTQFKTEIPVQLNGQSDLSYMVDVFGEIMRACKDNDISISTNDERSINASFIFGYRGNIYTCGEYGGIIKSYNNFDAIGSGWLPAIGAMKILVQQKRDKEHVKEMLTRAIKVSSEVTSGVESPFNYLSY